MSQWHPGMLRPNLTTEALSLAELLAPSVWLGWTDPRSEVSKGGNRKSLPMRIFCRMSVEEFGNRLMSTVRSTLLLNSTCRLTPNHWASHSIETQRLGNEKPGLCRVFQCVARDLKALTVELGRWWVHLRQEPRNIVLERGLAHPRCGGFPQTLRSTRFFQRHPRFGTGDQGAGE